MQSRAVMLRLSKYGAGVHRPSISLRGTAVLLLAMAIFSSCNKTEEFIIDYKYDYYPLETGHYVVYDVDSIVIDDFTQTTDTFRYQKKYVIDSTFTDNIGRAAYKLIRYQRGDPTQGWTLTDVWYVVRTETTLEVNEENQRFVKLLFPPDEGQTWNGNQYIDSVDANWYLWHPSAWEYTISEVDKPAIINGFQFDSTLTVTQQSDSTLIEKVISVEKYAKHVGMIYKYFSALEKNGDITRPWSNPESGFILVFSISEYGN